MRYSGYHRRVFNAMDSTWWTLSGIDHDGQVISDCLIFVSQKSFSIGHIFYIFHSSYFLLFMPVTFG